ncbi:MAG: sulfotransferase domain-containing protein [Campylobacterales bacterium]
MSNKLFLQKYTTKYPNYGVVPQKENFKIAVIGLPKSGNNWLHLLLKGIFSLETIDYMDKDISYGIVNWHNKIETHLDRSDISHAVYIMRDIRDIVVSYYHYSQTDFYRERVNPSSYYTLKKFYYEYFLSILIYQYDWLNHAEKYSSCCIPIIKYEDLLIDAYGEVDRLLKFWGIRHLVKDEAIEKAIYENRFDKLHKEGANTYGKLPPTHFRKGISGEYKTELVEEVLKDINKRFAAYMERWGYTIDD